MVKSLPVVPSDALPVLPSDLLIDKFAPMQPLVTKSSEGGGTYIARFPPSTQENPTGASRVLACVAAYVATENGRPGFSLLGGFSRDADGFFIAPFSIDERSDASDTDSAEISTTGSACADMVRPQYRWE